MISQTDYNVKNPKLGRKIWCEGHLQLSLFINLSITIKFPTKIFLKTVDSSVRNPGEVEYDKQNWLQHQKTQAWPKNSKCGQPPINLLSLFVNRSITKKFPIETLLETVDSSVKNLGNDNQNCLQHQKTPVRTKNSKWGLPPIATVHKLVNNRNVSNWNNSGNDRF